MLFIPYMYSLGVSLGYTLLAAVFYPSAKMDGMKDENKEYPTYQELQDDTIQNYYS
jgi:hypothetical protein